MEKRALLLIDIQNDFCPGGNLAVTDGDQVVPVANQLIEKGRYDLILASQDWHPAGHSSFVSQHGAQALWPDHCVQGTKGAEFHHDLNTVAVNYVQQKGMNPAVDSYSAFRDNDKAALTGLADYLKSQGITELDVCGLATDYCVKASALDAVALLPGVKVRFIEDASRGITPDGVAAAKAEMAAAGVETVQSHEVITPGRNTSGDLQADDGLQKRVV